MVDTKAKTKGLLTREERELFAQLDCAVNDGVPDDVASAQLQQIEALLVAARQELARVQRLPVPTTAEASAAIMGIAAQLARNEQGNQAVALRDATDKWKTYMALLQAERDELHGLLRQALPALEALRSQYDIAAVSYGPAVDSDGSRREELAQLIEAIRAEAGEE